MGAFPSDFFAFPLNAIFALMWIIGCVALWRNCRKTLLVKFLLSPFATLLSIFCCIALCLVIGITGRREWASSWVAVVLFFLLQTVVLFVLMRGWRMPTATGARLGAIRWRFVFLHFGLLLALGSSFWGAPDTQTMRLKAEMGHPVNEAIYMDGRGAWLPYEITLKDFQMDTYENGTPSDFRAVVTIDGEDVCLRVNHPYSKGFNEDIYLIDYDKYASSYCILQIVREPWKYGTVAGIVLMMFGALLLFINGPVKRYRDE